MVSISIIIIIPVPLYTPLGLSLLEAGGLTALADREGAVVVVLLSSAGRSQSQCGPRRCVLSRTGGKQPRSAMRTDAGAAVERRPRTEPIWVASHPPHGSLPCGRWQWRPEDRCWGRHAARPRQNPLWVASQPQHGATGGPRPRWQSGQLARPSLSTPKSRACSSSSALRAYAPPRERDAPRCRYPLRDAEQDHRLGRVLGLDQHPPNV